MLFFQPHTHVLKPKVDPGSEEYVLEQLSLAEQKLVSLAEELSSRDLETIHKEMADEEVKIIDYLKGIVPRYKGYF